MHPRPTAPTPPFHAPSARRLREGLGMTPGHVAYGLRAQYGLSIAPETVVAWERGTARPDARELTALAGVLWCSPEDLLAAVTTLREYRVGRGLSPDDLARRVGLDPRSYARMEDTGQWSGNDRQTSALARALGLGPRELVSATGRDAELAELLRDAVTTRWQAHVRPAAKLVPLGRDRLEDVLQRLHAGYQARTAATYGWSDQDGGDGEAAGREYLDRVLEHFWALAGE
ncbi:helix-turn-helix domain-containing protein [Streptomyces fradiae]|uniref:helix-turn-helix domain-containing protein n=1 Tax=Streptomyces fradiae TaxID=1906 RepID=UPI003F4CE299